MKTNYCVGVLVSATIIASGVCNSISDLTLLDWTKPICTTGTPCNVKPGTIYSMKFKYLVEQPFKNNPLKWRAVVGDPKYDLGLFTKYSKSQTLFRHNRLCRSTGGTYALRRKHCTSETIQPSSVPYNVTVYDLDKLPSFQGKETLYLLNDNNESATLELVAP